MFNLEQSIAEWRKQMLVAGIKTPVPLEELESHLREEIEKQVKSGNNEETAFEMAALQMGHAKELKAELAKETGWLNLPNGTFANINRVLAILWLIICWQHVARFPVQYFIHDELSVWVYPLAIFIYGVGALGSALLFCGSNAGCNVIRFIAGFGIIAFFINHADYSYFPSTRICMLFNLITLWLLNNRRYLNPIAAS